MQSRMSPPARVRLPVLADAPEVVARTLLAQPGQWYRVAGSDYCRSPQSHAPACRCAVRILTQTAYRIRTGDLSGFTVNGVGCFQATALSASQRPDRQWDVEIKARWLATCP